MPTYDYLCEKCGYKFEYFQGMLDEPLKTCPKCESSVKRLIGGGMGIIFKGSGFYVNDSKSKKSEPTSSAPSKPSPEGKAKSDKKEKKAV